MRNRNAKPDPRLPDLLRAAEMLEDRETQALARLTAEIARLREAHRQAGLPADGELLASGFAQSGGLARWQMRSVQERRKINAKLAPLMAAHPAQAQKARRAIGRRLALQKLAGRRP